MKDIPDYLETMLDVAIYRGKLKNTKRHLRERINSTNDQERLSILLESFNEVTEKLKELDDVLIRMEFKR